MGSYVRLSWKISLIIKVFILTRNIGDFKEHVSNILHYRFTIASYVVDFSSQVGILSFLHEITDQGRWQVYKWSGIMVSRKVVFHI